LPLLPLLQKPVPPGLGCASLLLQHATNALPPSRCAPPPRFALPPPPRPCHAAAGVALSRCHRHRRNLRAAATALPPLRCASPPRFALLPPPPRCRQAAANAALLSCRHRRSIRAATFALPPLRCRRCAVALPPPLQPYRCCHGATAIALCAATAFRAAAKLPPASRCRAAGYLPLLGEDIRQSHDVSQLCVSMSFVLGIVPFWRFSETLVQTYLRM
jgi:hypothetical protein